ncbi:MAG: hypothetical protein LBU35_03805 [Holosporales bacterium]|nr:hypothetical protein [Holosporales bacterium]
MKMKMIIALSLATALGNFSAYAGEDAMGESVAVDVPAGAKAIYSTFKLKEDLVAKGDKALSREQILGEMSPWGKGNDLDKRLYGNVNLLCNGIAKAMNETDFKNVIKNAFSTFHALYISKRKLNRGVERK